MREWHRALFRMTCGADGSCWIARGQAYVVISGVSGWKLRRCERHAGEAAPDELPEDVAPAPPTTRAHAESVPAVLAPPTGAANKE
jgi:hypothetical protein